MDALTSGHPLRAVRRGELDQALPPLGPAISVLARNSRSARLASISRWVDFRRISNSISSSSSFDCFCCMAISRSARADSSWRSFSQRSVPIRTSPPAV